MKKLIKTEWAILAGTAAISLVSSITTKNPTYVLWGIIAISGSMRCIMALQREEMAKYGEDFYKKLYEMRSDDLIELSIEIDRMNKERGEIKMKARIPKPTVTVEQQQKEDRKNEKSNRSYLNYAHRCLLLSLHKNMGFGAERMRTTSYNSYEVGEEAIADNTVKPLLTSVEDLMAGAEPEFGEPDFFETVASTYWHLRKELMAFGWDPEESLWPWKDPFSEEDFPQTWRKITKSQREKREAFLHYANAMSQICLTLMCMCAKELHNTNGFGAERMDRAMRPVGERWRAFMRIYLTMDEDAVEKAKRELLREYNAMRMFTEERVL